MARRLAVFLGVAALAAVLAPMALAHPYTAIIDKTTAGTGDTDPYKVTITNKYASEKATKAELTIPGGWAVPAAGVSVSADEGSWSVALSSGKIVATATSGGLGYNKALRISFAGAAGTPGAGICSGGSSTWTPKVTRGSTVFSLSGSAPKVTVSKPGRLSSFGWSLPAGGAQVQAGTAFAAKVTAYDGCNNVKSNYTGPATLTGNLGTSPGFPPTVPGTSPSYGALTWAQGVGSASVTAFNAAGGQTLTVSDTSVAPAVSKESSPFSVVRGPLVLKFSKFTPDPGLAELGVPVARDSSESAADAPVEVLATDAWGNLADPGTQVTVFLNAPSGSGGDLVPGPSQVASTNTSGIASFTNLAVDAVASGYTFTASAPGAPLSATSGEFSVRNDLSTCTGNSCSNTASLPSGQSANTQLVPGASNFTGELLSTTFSTDALGAPAGACDGFTPISGTAVTEVKVDGGNPQSSKPTFTITLRVPGNLLPTRFAWLYNVCLGTTPFESTGAWLTKTLNTSGSVWSRRPAVFDGTRYWGIVPSCAFASGDPLPWLPIPSTNPCIVSKQRTGFLGLTGDLIIVLKKPYPWDGRWSTG